MASFSMYSSPMLALTLDRSRYAMQVRNAEGSKPIQELIAELIDLDGDGYPDRVLRPYTSTNGDWSNWFIQRNLEGTGFDDFELWSNVDFSYISIDFGEEKITLGKAANDSIRHDDYESSYKFAQIAQVELISNEAVITSTNRGSQLLGAAVGGVAFGGLGAVVGGLSGSSRSSEMGSK